MNTKPDEQHKHFLKIKVQKGVNNVLIGQLEEIPSLIVQAKTEALLKKEMSKAFEAYFDAFPEEHDKIFHPQKLQKGVALEPEKIPLTVTMSYKRKQ